MTVLIFATVPREVYVYHFDYVDPDLATTGLGVIHGSELKFIFNNLIDDDTWNEEAKNIANEMQSAWINYIKHGNPNVPSGNQTWQNYDPASPQEMHIDKERTMRPVLDRDDVVFINQRLQRQR